MLKKSVLLLVSLCAFAVVFSGTAAAQEDDWQFVTETYGWYASLGGDTASGSDIDVETDTLIDDLDFAFMGAFGAQKGKWSFGLDVIYMDLEDDTTGRLGGNINVEVENWIVTPLAGYNVLDSDKTRLDIVAGARYLSLKTDLTTERLDLSVNDHVWDVIVGLRGEIKLDEKWYLPFYGDIGTGDSELTWQVSGGIGYRFEKFDVVVTYRYLNWEFDDSRVFDTLDVSGPQAGVKIRF